MLSRTPIFPLLGIKRQSQYQLELEIIHKLVQRVVTETKLSGIGDNTFDNNIVKMISVCFCKLVLMSH